MEASFEPVAARRTFEEAVAQIAGKVEAGELRPGDRLPPERALASRMRISRPTLREAVRVLVDARVLEVRRGQSGGIVVVSDVVPREFVRAKSELRVGEVAGVLEARRLLEPRVAQLAAAYATEEDLAALERTIHRQREVAGDPDFLRHEDRFLQLDLQFHLTLARATRNSTVVSLMSALFRRLAIARDMAIHMPLVPDWAVDIHVRTLAAVRGGDFDEIDAVMDEHLAKLEQTWEHEVRRPPRRALPPFLR